MQVNPITNQMVTNPPQTSTVDNNTEDFSSYLQTTASMDQIFDEASSTYGVPKNLLKAIAKAESNFNPQATSGAGAQGVMQLMPRTAAYLGVTDSYDAYQNIMGGAKYIKEMLDMYDGNVNLALAAYNAGCNNVDKYGGIPPFNETQNYVVKVNEYMNGGVQVPDATYTISSGQAPATNNVSTENTSSSITAAEEETYYEKLMNQIFSYDDYLRFLDLYLKIQELEKSKENDQEDKKQEETNAQFAFQQIKYNPTILNLLSGSEII